MSRKRQEEQANIERANAESMEKLGRPLSALEAEIARLYPEMAVGAETRHTKRDPADLIYPQDKVIHAQHFKLMDAPGYMSSLKGFERKCLEHINWLETHLPTVRKLGDVRISTYSDLAIHYERLHEFEKALEIARKANALGLRDTTKDHFEKRIARLEKRIVKNMAGGDRQGAKFLDQDTQRESKEEK